MLNRIISGGQTGVDRAALDAALAAGFPCGGWCPKDRWAEDGPIDPRYPLDETESADPAVRTRANVAAADGTLILCPAPLEDIAGGTGLAAEVARESGRPLLVVELPAAPAAQVAPNAQVAPDAPAAARDWLASRDIATLNIAGPRESTCPGVYRMAYVYVAALLALTG